jgi:hypothetical protein
MMQTHEMPALPGTAGERDQNNESKTAMRDVVQQHPGIGSI